MSIGNKQKSDPSWKDRSDISKINYFFKRFMTFSQKRKSSKKQNRKLYIDDETTIIVTKQLWQ